MLLNGTLLYLTHAITSFKGGLCDNVYANEGNPVLITRITNPPTHFNQPY